MADVNDSAFIAEFADHRSEAAFAELVQRHIHLVYSVALRYVGNEPDAQDVVQAVFIILTRKAAGLRRRKTLTGWLYDTTRFTARQLLRTRARQKIRDQEAYMQAATNDSNENNLWLQLAPHIEQAMSRLRASDRELLALRFYENKTSAEAAALLGIGVEAAHKRTARALGKLQKYFAKRGVNSTGEIIAGTIPVHLVQTAPAALIISVTAGGIAKGAISAASIMPLVKGTMKTMTWLKIKFAMSIGVVALLVVGVATMAISQSSNDSGLTAQEIAQKSQAAYTALTSYSDSGKVVVAGGSSTTETSFNIRLQRPNLYRVDWSQTSGFYTSKGIVWSEGTNNYFLMGAANKINDAKPETVRDMQMALGSATGVSGSATADIPGAFFNQNWGDPLKVFHSSRAVVQRLPDEKIGGTECDVIASTLGPVDLPHNTGTSGKVTKQLWIGKKDHLIHKVRTISEGASVKLQIKDENIKTILERQGKPATPEAIAALRIEMEKSMKAAQGGKFVFIQTHENILVNQKFSPSDFRR